MKYNKPTYEDLENQNIEYKLLFDTIKEGIYATNSGLLTNVNKAFCDLFGFTKNEVIGKPAWNLAKPELQNEVKESFIHRLKIRDNSPIETICMRKNGEIFLAEISISIISETTQSFGVVRDISEKIKKENEILKAKEKSEENEKKYRLLYENNPMPMSIFDTETLNFLSVNEAFTNKYGYTREEFLNMSVLEIRPDTEIEKLKQSVNSIDKGVTNAGIFLHKKKNGEIFHVEIIRDEIIYENKIAKLVLINDVTDKIKAKNDLLLTNTQLTSAKEKAEESEAFLSNILDNIPNMIFVKNAEDLKFVHFNKAGEKLLGYKSEELIGKNDYDLFQKTEADLFLSQDKNAFNSDKPIVIEEESINTKFGIKTLYTQKIGIKDKKGNYKYLLGISEDITEKIEIQRELKKAKEKAEESIANITAIIENTKDNIWSLDSDYELTYINQTFKNDFYNTFGIKLEIGDNVINKLPEPMQKQWKKYYDRVFSNEQFTIIDQIEITPEKSIYIQVSMNPIVVGGKVVGASFFGQDITEHKEYEHELQKAKEKAEESDSLKTAFLQNMSHEIRTPLNAISGFSGLLNSSDLTEEKRKSFVSIIQNSSKQLISIVTDILTISSLETKQEKQNIEKVSINNIIIDLLAIFKQQSQNQNISLYAKQQLSDSQSEVYTDKTKLIQILTNLLSNALKFTHEGFIEFGYILVDTVSVGNQGQELEFYVKDSGIGIKPELHEKIFERFRQAGKSIQVNYGGTGLGLSISKGFIELLGGIIRVQSEPNKGATFYFTIPYKPVNEIDKTISPAKQNENFKTILVAEDEEYNFLFIEELLINLDLKLIHAKDGQETVEIFKTNPNIDLILMDIKMPKMTGHEAAKIIKVLKPGLPIIAQTAYVLENDRAKYEEIFDDYLTKPIDKDIFVEKVSKYIKNK